MLLQSQAGKLQLLPALPGAWPSGAVSSIFARGNFAVDLRWDGGKLVEAEIKSGSGVECIVEYPGISSFKLVGAEKVVDGPNQIHFATVTGQSYALTP
jgi:alpha-L-fucosidase 2